VLERRGPQGAPLWLLLPALSTVSSRGEWKALAETVGDQRQLVSIDWPGFGESDRPAIPYDAALLRSALRAVLSFLKCGLAEWGFYGRRLERAQLAQVLSRSRRSRCCQHRPRVHGELRSSRLRPVARCSIAARRGEVALGRQVPDRRESHAGARDRRAGCFYRTPVRTVEGAIAKANGASGRRSVGHHGQRTSQEFPPSTAMRGLAA
jgi:hypothetical protein